MGAVGRSSWFPPLPAAVFKVPSETKVFLPLSQDKIVLYSIVRMKTRRRKKKIFVKMHSRPEPSPPRPPPLQFKSFSFTEFRLINILIHFFFYFSSRVVYIVNQKLYRKPSFFLTPQGLSLLRCISSSLINSLFILYWEKNKTRLSI